MRQMIKILYLDWIHSLTIFYHDLLFSTLIYMIFHERLIMDLVLSQHANRFMSKNNV